MYIYLYFNHRYGIRENGKASNQLDYPHLEFNLDLEASMPSKKAQVPKLGMRSESTVTSAFIDRMRKYEEVVESLEK
jgi:hypothetical protein